MTLHNYFITLSILNTAIFIIRFLWSLAIYFWCEFIFLILWILMGSSMRLSLNDDPWEDFKKSNRLSQLYLSVIHVFFQYLPTQFHLQLEGSWDELLNSLSFLVGAAVSRYLCQPWYRSSYVTEWTCLYCKLHHLVMLAHLPWTADLSVIHLSNISLVFKV